MHKNAIKYNETLSKWCKNKHGASKIIDTLETYHDCTGEVHSLTFQGENPRSGINWLCLTMVLLKALFWEGGLSLGWKPKTFDRATIALVLCSFVAGIAYGEVGLLVLSWWCLVLLLQVIHCFSGDFLFSNYSLFFWLCAFVMPLWQCIVVEARCTLVENRALILDQSEH
jgi:hypothetical protein